MEWIKPTRGLRKRCSHFQADQLCQCDWVVTYGALDRFNLTLWNSPAKPHPLGTTKLAEAAFAALKEEVALGVFKREGRAGTELPTQQPVAPAGPTLNEFLDRTYKPHKFKKHGYEVDHLGDEFVMMMHATGEIRRTPAASLGLFNNVLILQKRWGKENLKALSNLSGPQWVERFNELQKERGVRPRTMNRYFAALSGIFRYAIEAREISVNPCSGSASFKKDSAADNEKRDRRVDPHFEEMMLKICLDRGHEPISEDAFREESSTGIEMHRRLLGALDTGLREAELTRVRVSHVRFTSDGIVIVLPAAMHKGGKTTGESRTAYASTHRMVKMLTARMKQLKGTDGFIFGREDGTPVSDFAKTWKTLFEMVGLGGTRETFTWHDLKHEFMSRAADLTDNPELLRQLGGHRDLKTSMKYITVNRKQLAALSSRLTEREPRTTRRSRPTKTA